MRNLANASPEAMKSPADMMVIDSGNVIGQSLNGAKLVGSGYATVPQGTVTGAVYTCLPCVSR